MNRVLVALLRALLYWLLFYFFLAIFMAFWWIDTPPLPTSTFEIPSPLHGGLLNDESTGVTQEALLELIQELEVQKQLMNDLLIASEKARNRQLPELSVPEVRYGTYSVRQMRKIKGLFQKTSVDAFRTAQGVNSTFDQAIEAFSEILDSGDRINWPQIQQLTQGSFARKESVDLKAGLQCSETAASAQVASQENIVANILREIDAAVDGKINSALNSLVPKIEHALRDRDTTPQVSGNDNKDCITMDAFEDLLDHVLEEMRARQAEEAILLKRARSPIRNGRQLLDQPMVHLIADFVDYLLYHAGGRIDGVDRWIDTLPANAGHAFVQRLLGYASLVKFCK